MKAVIFNSGLGKRMGALTEDKHKSMVRLPNDEAIFERQLRLLHECGIEEFVVTVGPFKEQLIEASRAPHLRHCHFTFVENPLYDKTNYIYSMYLAREYFTGDLLMLHGDLVFNKRLAWDILHSKIPSLGCVNRDKPLPEKDFKARVADGRIHEVSIHIFDENCFAFQPFYKLSADTAAAWVAQVEAFIEAGENQCYAENAFNEILPRLDVQAFGYESYFIDEVDNEDDLRRVSGEIRRFDFAEQETHVSFDDLNGVVRQYGLQKPLVVCGSVFHAVKERLAFDYVRFDGFHPNPMYDEVYRAAEVFRENGCDSLISIGGGSAIDVAKGVKMLGCEAYKHIAVPTTAGTGSESTRFSVVYRDGEKQSLTHDKLFPDVAILDGRLLDSLPDYYKKTALLDALCHGIESLWSVNADEGSQEYAAYAIQSILARYKNYLSGDKAAAQSVMKAANVAGQAINVSQTTAGHAMSYKITSTLGAAHGHAVALCLPKVWRYIAAHTDQCIDPRGEGHLKLTLRLLNNLFNVADTEEAVGKFEGIFNELGMEHLQCTDEATLQQLAASVNPQRLGNNPVPLPYDVLLEMYRGILQGDSAAIPTAQQEYRNGETVSHSEIHRD